MHSYYGLAIRNNKNQLFNMKKSIGAVLYHCTALANEELRHRFCPKGEESWCKWQVSKNTNAQYVPKINIPKWIHDEIRPIFLDLSKDELLAKCLHGETQNNNESLNNMIWAKCPKMFLLPNQYCS